MKPSLQPTNKVISPISPKRPKNREAKMCLVFSVEMWVDNIYIFPPDVSYYFHDRRIQRIQRETRNKVATLSEKVNQKVDTMLDKSIFLNYKIMNWQRNNLSYSHKKYRHNNN